MGRRTRTLGWGALVVAAALTATPVAGASFVATPVGAPSISKSSMTLGPSTAKLAFTANAGKNAPLVKSVTISLPSGLRYSTKSKDRSKGLVVGGHAKFSTKVKHTLTITLKTPASKLQATLSKPFLVISQGLFNKLELRKVKSATVKISVVDAAGVKSSFKLTFKLK